MKIDLTNRVANSARNSIVGLAAQCIQMISTMVCRLIFVRCLAQEYLGVSGLFSNVLSILAVAELGIGSAITFELYKALADGDDEQIASLMAFYKKAYNTIGAFIAVCGIAVMPFIKMIVNKGEAVHESIYLLYALYLGETVLSYFFSYKQTIIQTAQQSYIITITDVATGVLRNVIQCVILILTRNFLLYLIIQVFFKLVYNLVISQIAEKMFPVIKNKNPKALPADMKKRMFNNVRYVFVGNFLGRMMNSTDNIIITALDGLAMTGVNSNYTLIISTIITFTTKIQNGVGASIGNINAVETDERKVESLYEVFLLFFWMYFWCALCFILMVQDTVELFFGASYVLPMEIGIITAVNFMYYELSTCRASYHNTLGLFKYGRYTVVVSGTLNVVLSILLGKEWGLFGVLFATLLSRMSTGWYNAWLTFKHGFKQSVWPYYRRVIRAWSEGAVILLITWIICDTADIRFLPLDLAYRFLVCLIVPNLLMLLFNYKKPEFGRLKFKIIRFVKNRRKA